MGANWEGEDANDVSIIRLRVRHAMEIGFNSNTCWRMYVMFQSFSAHHERSRFLFLIVFLSHAQNVKILNNTLLHVPISKQVGGKCYVWRRYPHVPAKGYV